MPGMATHCPECGFVNPEAANYCQKCGTFIGRREGIAAMAVAMVGFE